MDAKWPRFLPVASVESGDTAEAAAIKASELWAARRKAGKMESDGRTDGRQNLRTASCLVRIVKCQWARKERRVVRSMSDGETHTTVTPRRRKSKPAESPNPAP